MANSFAATVTSSRVLAVQGEVWVTDANGERRALTANDQIVLGEWVATAPGAVLMLAVGEAAVVTLGQEEKLRFDKAFLAELDKQAEDGSLQDAVNFEAIEQALTEGRSLDEILPAAAAGDGPLSSNNSAGTGGVRVDLTAERVTPQSGFETSTTGYDSNRQFNDIGGRDSDGLATAVQPTVLSINPLAVDDIINAEEQNQPLILSGNATNAPDGALVTVSFNGNQYLAQVSNGQWTATVPAADLQAAADGPYTLTVNAGTAEASRSFAIDTQANAAINFTSTVTADNELSLAEANGTVTLTGNVTGDFSAGDLVTLTVNGVNYTGPLAADGSFSIDVAGSDLQADVDSAITASFIATDAAGNTQTVTNQLAYQVEAPNPPGTATIAGTVAEDEVLTAQLTDPDGVASVQGYQWFANGVPISGATAETYQLTDADVGTQITVAISYTDARGETATVTSAATSAVSPVNDNPAANDDAPLITDEDTPVNNIDVLSNDTDVDGDPLTVTAASALNGTVTINTDGTLNYTPNPNYSGTDTISYTISDGNGGSDSASVTVNITPVNDAPTTSPVTLNAIAEDSGARIITQAELLANAGDVDGDSLTAENLAIASGNGTLVDNGDGTWTYTPQSNDDTAVSFSYDINDGTTVTGGSASLDITPVNDAPTTSPVTLSAIAEDSGARIITQAELLANAGDVDGDSLTAENLAIASGNGTLVDNGDGTWTYTPQSNDDTAVSFSYDINDGTTVTGGSASLDITPVNDAPTTSPVTLSAIAEDSGARIITQAELLANASDVDGDSLTAENLAIASGNGTLVANGDGTWTYTPQSNDDTAVSFSYDINDGTTVTGGVASLDLTPVNDAPTTSPVTLSAIAEDSGARIITQAELLANASDVDGDSLTAENLAIASGNGTLVANGDGTWTYTPASNDDTDVSFSYDINDGTTVTGGVASLDLTPVNDAPTTSPVTLSAIAEDSGARIITQAELLANASDVDGDSLTAENLAIASGNGTLVANGDGTWTYTPASNDDTDVSFSYDINDGTTVTGGSASLDLTPVNDAPTTSPVTLSAIAEDSGARIITQAELLANAGDVDGDSLTAENLAIASGNGTLVANGDGTWTYTPASNDDTDVSFSYDINDGTTVTGGVASLDLTPVNDAPTTSPVTLSAIAEDSGARIITQAELLANAGDVDGDSLTAENLAIASGNGTLVDNGDGTWTYTPQSNDDTAVSFSYDINDGTTVTGGSASLDITPVNDAPTTSPVTLSAIAEDSGARIITQAELLANAGDVDGDSLTAENLAIASGNGTLVANGDGTWTYTPASNDDTDVSFSYDINDGTTVTGGVASLDLTPVNDAPTTSPVTLSAIAEDSGARIITQAELLANAGDVDGDSLTAENLAIASGNGTLVANGDGTWTYTPASNDDTDVSFSYDINDGTTVTGGSASLDLTPVNDAPTTSPVTLNAIAEDSGARIITQAELLANAGDVDGDSLTAENLAIASGNGTLVANGDGTWTYTPASNDDTDVSFSYDINDGTTVTGGSASLDLTPVNDAPTTSPVTLNAIAEDSGARIITQAELLANAGDVDGDSLTAENLAIASGNGTLVANGDGTWTYTPASNDDTAVSFSYDINDGTTVTGGVASLDITPVNDAPTTSPVTLSAIAEDSGARIITQAELLANAGDVDGDSLTAENLAIASGNGTLVDNGDGTWTYTPQSNDDTAVSFSYDINDGTTVTGGSASLDITPVNDAPTTSPVTLSAIAEDSGARIITQAELLANASDVDGDSLTAENLAIASGNGTLVANGDGTWTYTPASNDDTDVSFSYDINDGTTVTGGSASLDLTPVNDAPTTSPVTLSAIAEDSGARIITQAELLANAGDVDGDSLTAENLAIASGNGTLVDNGDGTWTYTPASNDDTDVSFSYDINDGTTVTGGSASLDITPVNDAPTTSPVTLSAIAEDSGARIITQAELLANAGDVDGDSLTAENLAIASGNGTLVDNGDGTWTYTPQSNDDTAVSFSYDINDGTTVTGGSASLDITPVNDAPTTSPVTLSAIAEDSGARIITQAELLANAGDVDGDSLTAENLAIASGNGTLVANGDGTWTYTPASNDDTDVSFSYDINDGTTVTGGVASLDLTPVNDAPTTSPVTLSAIAEDSGARIITQAELLANAGDVDGDSLTAENLAIASGNGTLVANGDGTWTYTPASNDDTDVSFSYDINDGTTVTGGSASLDLTPVNDAPTTSPVTLSAIAEDSGARIITQAELLANASDVDGDSLTAENLAIASGNGTLVDNGDGTWTYTPASNDDTDVSFSYDINDGTTVTGGSASLDITPVNDAPTTSPVTLSAIAEDSGARIITQAELLANAGDVDGDSLTAENLAIASGNGTLVANGDGTWTYTPASNDDTDVSFSYDINDGTTVTGGSASLDLTPVNDAPTTSPVTLSAIAEDSGARIITQAELLANAGDVDGDSLTAENLAIASGNGTLVDNGDGTWTYTPQSNDDTAVSFSYDINDGTTVTGGSASLDLTPVNDAPTTSPVTLSAIAEDSGARIITQAELLANAGDVDGDSLTAENLAIASGNGTLVDNGDGTWTYTPQSNDDTAVSFSYDINDGTTVTGGSASLDLTPVNDAPTTSPVTLSAIAEDSGARIITQAELLANAGDVDGDSLTAENLAIASGNGTLVDNGDGTWTYTPASNDDTAVSFSYDINDGTTVTGGSASLDITPVNDAPTTSPVTLSAIAEDSGARIITQAELLANAGDVDGDSLTAENLAIASGNGTLVANGDGTWTYTPASNDDTDVSFSYDINDGTTVTGGVASLDLTPVNDAPTTSPVTLSAIAEDSGARIITQAELLANAGDVDGDSLTAENLAIASGNGTLVANGDGTWTYTPASNDDTDVSFSYDINDGTTVTGGVASLDLTPVNDAPTTSPVTLSAIAEDSGARIITQAELLANAGDVDGDSLTAENLAIASGNGTLVANGDGTWTYTPASNDDTDVSFSYDINDGTTVTGGVASLDLTPVNDAPTTSPVTLSAIAEDSGARIITQAELLANAGDVDGDSLTAENLAIASGNGTLVANGDGTWTYTPASNDDTDVSFSYDINDGTTVTGGSASLDITPVNDAPTTSPVTLSAIAEDSGARIITQAELLANAGDVDGDSLTAENLAIASGNGTLVANGDGTWTYTPQSNDDTAVSFSYDINDGTTVTGGSASLDITPVNDAPTTSPVTLSAIAEDSGARIITQAELLANAGDVDGDSLTAENLAIASGNGTLVDNGDGTWTYTPQSNDDTAVSFSYDINDGTTVTGGSASLDITPVNDAPTTSPVTLSAIAEDSGARIITQAELLANAGDVDGDSLMAENLAIASGNGTLVDNGDGTWTYTPQSNDDTAVSFSYDINDGTTVTGGSASLDITPVNDAPTTSPVTLSAIAEDSGARIITQAELLANAGDVDGDSLMAENLAIASGNGTLVDNGDGTWTYTPQSNDDTAVSFSYDINDGTTVTGGSASLDITPVNDAPTTSPVTLSAIAEDSGARIITQAELLANAGDVDGDSLMAENLAIASGNGTLVDNGDGTWTYTPQSNDDTAVSFSYDINDGTTVTGGSASLDITPVNDAPTTSPVTLSAIAEDSGARIITQAELLANAGDVDGDSLMAENLAIASGNGTLVDNGDGTWTYTPQSNDDTAVSFSYDINDGTTVTGGSASLDITPVNDAPTTSPVTLSAIAEDSGARIITQAELLANAGDVDGDSLMAENLAIASGNGTLVDNGDGTWTYTPQSNDDTDVSFSYDINDGTTVTGGSASLDITPVNDAPTTSPVTLSAIAEDSGARIITQAELLANAGDVDGDSLMAENLAIASGNGTLVDNGDGTWTYTPQSNDDTAVSFSYDINDGTTVTGGSASLDITPVNDAPTTSPVTLSAIAEDSGARIITQAELLANAGDVDGDSLMAENLAIASGNGTLVDNGDGTWTYTPQSNDDTAVSFSYDINDGTTVTGGSASLDITPVNDAPTTSPVTLSAIAEDSGARIITQAELLANAGDVDGDSLMAENLAIASGNGTLVDNGDGTWTYTPQSNDDTAVSFSYDINDGTTVTGGSASLDITPVNDAPTTSPVTLSAIAEDSGARIITQAELLANAGDVDGDSLMAENLAIASGNGTLVDNGDGTWTYTPQSNDDTAVSFSYDINDGTTVTGGSASLDITPVNDAPTTSPVTLSAIAEDSGARIITQAELLANAGDVDGDSLTAENLAIASGNGTLVDNGDGTWTYTPQSNDDTAVSFSYDINDGTTVTGGSASLDITPVNDAPTTSPVTLSAIAEDSGARIITQAELLANAGDVDGDSLTAENLAIASGNGTLVANGDGTWTYTPQSNDDTAVSFSYDINDGTTVTGGSASLDITPVNDAPTTSPVTLSAIAEDSGARIITQAELLANAGDVDGDSLTAENLAIASGNGTLVDNGDGTWTYTPQSNDDTAVSFSYDINDGTTVTGGSASLDITPVNDAPTTSPVTLSAIAEDSGARIITQAELLANAGDVDGDSLTAENLAIASGNGTLVANGDGTWTYTPASNDDTDVSFSYDINDGTTVTGGSASLDLTPVNDAPTTSPVTLSAIAEDSGARIITQAELLANAGDVDGDSLTAENLAIASGNGTLVDNGDGTWTYTPQSNDDTAVSFSYDINDGTTVTGGSASLDLTPVNDAPTTSPVTLSAIAEDSGARIITQAELLANAGDVDGDSLTAENLAIASGNGTLVANGDGTWTYTPASNDDTDVSFSYDINDGTTVTGGSASLDLTPVNDAPTTSPVTLSAIAEDSGARIITQAELLANASDVDGDSLTAENLAIASGNGTLVDNGDGTWTYTPASNDDTDVSFSYDINDGTTVTGGVASLDLTPVNDAPTTSPVTLSAIAEDSGARIITQAELLANASDVDGDSLTAENLAIASGNGTLVANGDGTWTYTPASNDDTDVSFSYDINDGTTVTGGVASLDLTPVNDAPTTSPVTLSAIAEDSGARIITQAELLANAGDVDGDSLTAENLAIASGNGTLVDNGDGTWTYTPASNDDTDVSFSYDINDGTTVTGGVASLDLTPVNDAPTTSPVTLSAIAEDSGARIITQAELLANASDVDGDSLTAENLAIASGNGTLVANGDGTWTYTPASNDDTAVSFSYDINDGTTVTGGVASLDITPVNDAPTTSPVTLSAIAEDSGARIITQAELLANAGDVDGDSLTAENLAIASGNGTLVANGDGTWTYTPASNDDTDVSFSYDINDGTTVTGGSASLDLTPVNDAPTTSPVTLSAIAEDSGARIITQAELLANAGDVDGDSLTAENLAIASGNGTLVDNGDGTWTYTPQSNDDTAVSFSYDINDGTTVTGGSASLDLTPVNDAPTTSPVTLSAIAEDSGARIITQAELLANAGDVDGDSLTAENLAIASGNGTLVDNGDGTWTYTPQSNDDTAVSFSYDINDGTTVTGGVASLDLTPVNDAPTTSPVTLSAIAEDSGARIITQAELLANAGDVDGDSLTAENLAIASGNGTLVDNGDGTWTYTPASNDDTAVSFSYDINDGTTVTGGSASLDITPVNDAPTTSPVTLSAIAEDSGARIITQAELLANAGDVDGDSLTAENLAIASGNGTLVANGDGTWTYTPASNDDTDVSFSYDINDGTTVTGGSASLNLTPVNDAPVLDLDGNNSNGASGADFQTSFTEGGSAVRIADTDVVISDVDSTTLTSARIQIGNVESGDLLTVGALPAGITASAYNPSTGVLTLSGSASLASYQQAIRAVQFSNDGSASGADKDIQISVFDGQGWSNTAHTTVTMVLIPTVSVADVSVQEPQSGTTTLTFTINIDTPPSSDLTFTYQTASGSATGGDDYVQVGPLVGTIAAGATSTTVSITVNSDSNVFEGDESFTLNLSGFNQTVNFAPGSHLTANGVQAIGTIGANNGAPVAEDDVFITSQDQVLTTGNVLANDTLVDGAAVGSFDAVSTNGGSVVYNNDGTFTYTPSASFIGTDTFTYTLIDADGETDTATVTIEVADTVVQPPQVSGLADINYIENAAATALFSGVGITDLDSANLSSVVVTIEGFLAGQDVIDYLTAGTNVTAVVNQTGTSWQVTLSGGADIGEYITVLESMTYQNSSENPSASTRSVTLEAFDQEYANIYGSDTLALSVTPVNDAPTVFDNNRFVVEGTVGAPMNIQAPTDVDSDDAELLITVTGIPEVATGVVSYADGITNPVAVGDVLTLSQLTSLLFHASGAESVDSFTYTVFDGELTTTGTTTLTVGATQPDFNTVYESGLPGGSGVAGQSATAEGNLFSNDGSGGGTITSIEFGGTAYTASGGVITVDTPLGLLTVDAATGDYTYQLTDANATGADVDEQFTYNFENGAPLSDTLTITIVDDVPIASNVSQTIPESEENTFNLMFSLDISTSMNASVGTSGDTRLSLAKQSLVSLAEEYFNQSTKVSLTVLLFANGAHRLGTYTDFEAAKAAIESVTDVNQTSYSNDLGGSGSLTNATSYVDALSMIRNEFTADLLGQNAADNVQNISYFLSDGAVTADGSPVSMGYKEFVNDNGIKSYSVGIGDGLPSDLTDLNYAHNIDSLGRGHGTVDPALIVSDVSLLQSELLSTVPTAFGGNITQEGTITRVSMGADGGHVASIVILLGDPAVEHTISYDGTNFTVSPALPAGLEVEGTKVTLNSDDGFAYGTFTMDFATGSYLFIAPNGTAEVNFQFDYTVIDGDGDSATATAKFNIVDDKPDARDDLHTGGYLDKIQGNVITGLGTDGGPALGAGFTPFAAQGGGVDKIVDAAKITAFSYRGVDFDLGIQINDVGVAEAVQLTTASALANSQFFITSPNGSLTFNADGLGVGDGEIDVGESVTIDFRTPELMYGVNDLVLSLRDFGNNNFARADVYDTSGNFLGQVSVRGDVPGDQLDLTAFENVGYVQLQPTSGGENDLTLYEVSYAPALIPNLDGSTGSLSYEYHIETSLNGDYVLEVKINDSSDGSEFVMRSNGFYEYLSPGANSLTPVDVDTTSAANVSASDITLNASSGVGYGSVGAHVQGGYSDGAGGRIQEGETLHVDFNGGAMPNGATDIKLSLGSYISGEAVYITVYGVGNQVLLNNQLFDSATLDLSDYVGVTRVSITGAPTNAGPGDLDSGRPTYVGLVGVHYAAVPAAVPTAINPELINYTLTDADGQMDTAQLALYTIDNRIAGTDNNDNIIGGNLNDAITGGAGNDILSGGAGHDSISGGDGTDVISGGSGNDYLAGGAGNDELYGNEGDDHLAGDAGDDLMDGGIGADILIGGDGDDRLFGGADNDKLYGGQGNDALYGGSGDDLLVGEAGDDLLNGGSGNDVLYGGEDQDTLIGGEGDDILFGGRGDDTLTGGNGADTFAWARGTIGTDTVTDFNTADGDKLDLSDLLVGEESGDIENYLQFNFSNGDTYISIDADAGGSFEVGQVIVLQGVDLTMGNTLTAQQIVDDLISGGNLTLDS